jgi:F0F1-type ATP synthase assembly protein I
MAVLAGIVGGIAGAVVGFVIGILLTEVVFANTSTWLDVIPVVLAVVGWLSTRELLRRRRSRRPEHGVPSASS